MKNTYYLMRHGQSEANVQGIIVSFWQKGVSGFGLTDVGRGQALSAIEKGLVKPDAIYSSDFKRARETAEIVHHQTIERTGRCELFVTPLLRERFFGILDGESDTNYEKVWAEDASNKIPSQFNAESPQDVVKRVTQIFTEAESNFDDRSILLVAHGDVCQILLAVAGGLAANQHRSVEHMKTAEIRPLKFVQPIVV